jgi:hypothetical protein
MKLSPLAIGLATLGAATVAGGSASGYEFGIRRTF